MFDDEKNIQKAVVRWIRVQHPEILITIAPSGQRRGTRIQRIIAGKEAKDMGYTAGSPDLMILEPMGCYHGLFIEFKTKTGSVEDVQKEFIERLRGRGYVAEVCRGFDQAVKVIQDYLTNSRKA